MQARGEAALPKVRDETRLMHAMGWETASVHLGSGRGRTLAADLNARPRGWMYPAAKKMEKAVIADFASMPQADCGGAP